MTVAVVAARRTPVGTAGHALAALPVADLAAPVLRELAGGTPVDDVILGNCLGPGGNPARVAALAAGLDAHTPAVTVGLVNVERKISGCESVVVKKQAEWRAVMDALPLDGKA